MPTKKTATKKRAPKSIGVLADAAAALKANIEGGAKPAKGGELSDY